MIDGMKFLLKIAQNLIILFNILTELNDKEFLKFGRKGGGKCILKIIVKLLKPCFHSGNHDKSQRFTPEDMHKELLEESACNSQFSPDEIPKVETIHF